MISPKPLNDLRSLKCTSANELMDIAFKPHPQVIERFLYSGLYILAGAPKIGKSFLTLQLAQHIATGTPIWGLKVTESSVLYMSLEDTLDRLQRRYYQMFGETSDGSPNLYFCTRASLLNNGLLEEMENSLKEHPDIKVIIIDTLQTIREYSTQISYSNDYEVITQLKRFADEHNLCLLVVHHTRKLEADDAFETISGTNGLLGAADGAFVLKKPKRSETRAVLNVVGRDIADLQIKLEFDRGKLIWVLTEFEVKPYQTPLDKDIELINKFLAEKWTGSATDLLKEIPEIKLAANTLTRKLNANTSILLNNYGIKYVNNPRGKTRSISLIRIKKEKSAEDTKNFENAGNSYRIVPFTEFHK